MEGRIIKDLQTLLLQLRKFSCLGEFQRTIKGTYILFSTGDFLANVAKSLNNLSEY